jgi:hypothetical protein
MKRAETFAWAQYTPTWSQAYAGPSFKIAKWLEVGIGGGVEQTTGHGRLGSFVSANAGKESFFAVYENGASGRWFVATGAHKLSKHVSVGFHAQDLLGIGPRTDVTFGQMTVWTALPIEKECGKIGKNFVFGVKFVVKAPKES